MTAPIRAQHWECGQKLCPAWATTYDAKIPHHACPYTGGLTVPLVRVGGGEHVRLVERQDHVGAEQVTMHDGRPVMAAERIRDDGYDTTVYPPTVRVTAEDREAP